MKITVLTVSTSALRGLVEAGKAIEGEYPHCLELRIFYTVARMKASKQQDMVETIINSDAVIVDLMGSPHEMVTEIYGALEKCKGQIIPCGGAGRAYMRLGELSASQMQREHGVSGNTERLKPEQMKKMAAVAEKMGKIMDRGKLRDMRNLAQIGKYMGLAEESQLKSMLLLLLRDYGGYGHLPSPKEARTLAEIAICDPKSKNNYEKPRDYWRKMGFDKEKPTIALLYYGHTYPNDTSGCVAELMERLQSFSNVLPLAFTGNTPEALNKLKKWLLDKSHGRVAVILNFMSFRLGAGPMGGDSQAGMDLLKEVGASYLHPFFMSRRSVEEWQDSAQGINSSEFMVSVMLPEFDGCIETIPIGAMAEADYNEDFDIDLRELVLIEERVDRLVSRVKQHLKLSRVSNNKKRLAIIAYNYPPGEDKLLGGAFLDTFQSIETILERLHKEGYGVLPLTAEQLMEEFRAGRLVNSGRYSDDEAAMLHYNPNDYRERLKIGVNTAEQERQWGSIPGEIMVSQEGQFLIPGFINGNVFIGLQPTRGVHESPERAYHDKILSPHHQYSAFYQWIREVFQADAVLHVGTHGTLEFLKGKECGMSGECFPDQLIGDVPHLYLYYVGNPAEAMIAKRRTYANLISYQPPVFVPGELYGVYGNLEALINEYYEALRLSPIRKEELMKNIEKMASENGLPREMEELERELYRMKRALIPQGLHIFSRAYSQEEAKEYVRGLLRYDRGEIKSLRRIAAESLGIDYDQLVSAGVTQGLKEVDNRAALVFDHYFAGKSLESLGFFSKDQIEDFTRTLNYGLEILRQCQHNDEMKGLFRALRGEYNPARLAGDLYRNPEVLPTGYNLYQFDPRFVPSDTAFERGKRAAENTLQVYSHDNRSLPASIALILWGLETSRTQGETLAQALTYLGVKVVKGSSRWESQFEIIPLKKLGRKRIDVVINICGFFRDMFPNLIEGFNEVLNRLAELDEPDDMNCYQANCKSIYSALIDQGYDEAEARELSRGRIFGPGEGAYGNGLSTIIETRNWQQEAQLGEAYISSLKHIYTKDYRGREVDGLFRKNLKRVDFVSQIRSSHEYEVTDLDHYYEFFGGLAKSVELERGEAVPVYITDTTGEQVETEGLNQSIGRGIRTRVLNPKWIDGMLAHPYHGVQKIAERFTNIMGLAATTKGVEAWVYPELYQTYVIDEKLRQRLQENNLHGYRGMIEQMLEYVQRGYWDADREQIEVLKNLFLELEGDIEEKL